MKYIVKGSEPQKFTNWKNQNPNNANLTRVAKSLIKSALIKEQGSLCCYCESKITDNNTHIEHLKPQSVYPKCALDFQNLLCSCLKNKQSGAPLHCGHKKDDWFDEAQLVSPLNPNCENKFKFMYDGRIEPFSKTDKAAIATIEKLGLNIPKLIKSRCKVIEAFEDEALSDEQREKYLEGYLEKDAAGNFTPYYTTIKYLYKTKK